MYLYRKSINKILHQSTKNTAHQRNFYRSKPINNDELNLLNLIFDDQPKNIKIIFAGFIENYQKVISYQDKANAYEDLMIKEFGSKENIPEDLAISLSELIKITETGVNNVVEDYMGDIEADLTVYLNLLKEQNAQFYYNMEESDHEDHLTKKQEFLFYVCIQHFRTKAVKDRWISSASDILKDDVLLESRSINPDKVNLENIAFPFLWFLSNASSYKLNKNDAYLKILVNKTEKPFLTSDQPIINLDADYSSKKMPTNLIFYYPISPDIAITINDSNKQAVRELSINEVDDYNFKMIEASYETIYSNSKEILEMYVNPS